MQPHVQRMHAERHDLEVKEQALTVFSHPLNTVFMALPPEKQRLMHAQLHAMRAYLAILEQRIALEG